MTREPYVSKEDAAAYLGLSVHAIEQRVHRRQIPFHKLGPRTLRFRLSELDRWVEEQTERAS